MDRLVHEIRSNFNNVDEVTAEATSKLPYLHAAIMEGLRIYPPIALGAPRVSPGALVNNEYIPRGVSADVSQHFS